MNDPQSPEALDRQFQAASIIARAMLASLIVYGATAAAVISSMAQAPAPDSELLRALRWLLYGLAAAETAAMLLLRGPIFSASALAGPARQGSAALLKAISSRQVILLALAETPAVYGLVLSLFTRRLTDYLGLAGISLVLFAAAWPSRVSWENSLASASRTGQ